MNRLDILLISDGNAWVAQCLQYYICAQGGTVKEAMNAFEYVLIAEVAYLNKKNKSLDSLPRAPQWCWNVYKESLNVETPKSQPTRVPPEIRNLLNTLVPAERECRLAAS